MQIQFEIEVDVASIEDAINLMEVDKMMPLAMAERIARNVRFTIMPFSFIQVD